MKTVIPKQSWEKILRKGKQHRGQKRKKKIPVKICGGLREDMHARTENRRLFSSERNNEIIRKSS